MTEVVLALVGGAALVAIAVLIGGRGGQRRAGLLGILSVGVPLGWGIGWKLLPVLGVEGAAGLAVAGGAAVLGYGAAAGVGIWMGGVLAGLDPPPRARKSESTRPASSPARPSPRAAPPPLPAPRAPAPVRPKPSSRPLPKIKPVAGAVAAAGRRRASDGAPMRDESNAVERDGHLRVLRQGPGFQQQAAARALAVLWTGRPEPAVVEGLVELLLDEGAEEGARAEAWIALCTVHDRELSWDDEVAARHRFPEGVDWDWVGEVDLAAAE